MSNANTVQKKLTEHDVLLEDLRARLAKLEAAVYGNGRDGMIERMARMESEMQNMKNKINFLIMISLSEFITLLGIVAALIGHIH